MDPLASLSLAATIIRFTGFARKLLLETHRPAPGQTQRRLQLSSLSQDLSRLSAEVQKAALGSPILANPWRQPLQECIGVYGRLHEAIHELQKSAEADGKTSAAPNGGLNALKEVWQESEIKDLRETLSDIQSRTAIAMLVIIR